jgi:hypothetical protein
MNRRSVLNASVALLISAVYGAHEKAAAQDDLPRLLGRLKDGSVDAGALAKVEGHALDQRTVPALKEGFGRSKGNRDKQLIAITLIHLGERSDLYFDFLARPARQAIEDRTPSFVRYDSDGRVVKGQHAVAFENWCAQNGKDPKIVAELQASAAIDVLLLARAQDVRATELFLQGLDSPHEFVAMYSVEGLGRLQVTSAIPKIAEVCHRLPAEAAKGLGMQLAWFSDVQAHQLMQRIIPDERLRSSLRDGIAKQRNAEMELTLRRGQTPTPRKD